MMDYDIPHTLAWINTSMSALLFFNATESSKCSSPSSTSVENISYSLFMGFILLFSVSGNSIVILVVVMSRSLKKRYTFYFIASLGEYFLYYMFSYNGLI